MNTSNTSPLPLPHSLCHFMHLHGCTFLIIYLVVSLSVYCLLWGAGNLCGWLHAVPFSLMHKNLSVNNKWAGLQFNCTPFPQTLLNHKCFLQQSNVSSYSTVTFYVNKSWPAQCCLRCCFQMESGHTIFTPAVCSTPVEFTLEFDLQNGELFTQCNFICLTVSISVFMALSTEFSRQLSGFSLCSSGLRSAFLVLSTIYLFMKVSFSPDIIPSGWLGSKHQLTN